MKKIQILITAMTFIWMCSASWAATYYINGTNGNDSNPGSQSAPWKTIGKANKTLNAGDTAYIIKGTYKETIRPSRSGKKGSYITYARNGNDDVIITGNSDGVNLADRSYVIVDGIKIMDVGGKWVNFRPNGSLNIIQNCHMEENNNYRGIDIDEGANYNRILNNTLIGKCNPDDLIVIQRSHHTLIEGNSFYYGTHDSMRIHDRFIDGQTGYTIVRNNYFQNKWHTILGICGVEYILVENNRFEDAGDNAKNNSCGSDRDRSMERYSHKGSDVNGKYGIYRGNVFVNNGSGFGFRAYDANDWRGGSSDNRVYNNTITENHRGIRQGGDGTPPRDNIVKNNIVYDNIQYEVKLATTYNTWINNNITGATIDYGSNDIIRNNLSYNPLFVDASKRDFRLQSNSKMIDAGAWLTTTASAGNGTQILVEDARYFMDGWGIIEGDLIQIEGQTETARVTNVDYKTNTITVNTSLAWAKGRGVSLPYKGSRPDIGAYEFSENLNNLQAPVNLRVVLLD